MTIDLDDVPEAGAAEPDVGRRTVRAAAWGFFAATGKRVLTLAGITLLARVLAPHDFGVIGFAMAWITFAEVIGDLGTASALIYWPERRDDAAQVTFIINAVSGVVWCVISLLVAPFVAQFFHEPDGTSILRLLSVSIVVRFLGTTHDALAQKDLRFRDRSLPELALTGLKAVVALGLAWRGFGAWSLVWGHIAGVTASTALLWVIVPWRPSWRVPADLFRPMLRYGAGILAIHLLAAVMFEVDSVAVGRMLGVSSLGIYQMAARVPDSSVMVLIWVAAQALFPALSQIHASGDDVKHAYLVATRCISALTFPASLGLFFLARPVILVFFGPQWVDAAPILSILALYVGFRGVDEVGNVLKATGRTALLVRLTVLKAVFLIPAVIFAATRGTVAVAIALAVVYGVGTLITTVIAARVIRIPLRAIAGAFYPSARAALVMSAALFAWMKSAVFLPDIVQLLCGVLGGGVIYAIALRISDPEMFEWIRHTILERKAAA